MHRMRWSLPGLGFGVVGLAALVVAASCGCRPGVRAVADDGSRASATAPRTEQYPPIALEPPANGTRDFAAGQDIARVELDQFVVPRRVSRVLPPVAERIVLDPSLAETPSLPTVPEPPAATSAVTPPPRAAVHPQLEDSPTAGRQDLHLGATERVVEPRSVWPWPQGLVEQLEGLIRDGVVAEWAERVLAHLRALEATESLNGAQAGQQLEELQRLRVEISRFVASLAETNARACILRAAYALERRLALWEPVHKLVGPPLVQVSADQATPVDVAGALQRVKRYLATLEHGAQWRKYLGLDALEPVAAQPWSVSASRRSEMARRILARMVSADLTAPQQAVLGRSPWRELSSALRGWVCEPVDYQALLQDIEQIECGWDQATANRIALQYQILRWSAVPQANELGSWVNAYYRNANVRVSVSAELVNRLLPELEEQDEPVNDMLLGARVLGRSRVSTQLRVVLVPDPDRWHVGLEAQGQVNSTTSTKHGPAKFYNSGRAQYLARKLLWIDRLGLRAHRAEADAVSDEDLTGLETELDGVPLISMLARSIARQQYDSQSHKAKWRVRDMIATRVQNRLDEEVDRHLDDIRTQFRQRVHQPLTQLGLEPEAVDMQTTRERLIARYRLAGEAQLAAFTPRPQAPTDALLSVQVHESAINNTVEALDLSRQTWDLRGLFCAVADSLQLANYQPPDDVPENVQITLAAEEPIHLCFSEDRAWVRLRIARLTAERRTWRNLEVKANYGPVADGLHTRLVRDGYVQLKARRLSFGDQIALRGIFSKVFPQDPELDLAGKSLGENPALQDLQVTQFVMRDGWAAVALSAGGPVHMHLADRSDDLTR